ncbi:MAG: hypothetical protein HC871_06595 [Rhizobiales bacterium]|nr:hypothetical protein [Hyphomicrobiales bacterium]
MLNKILITIFAIIAVWKVFSLIARLQNEGGILARDSSRPVPRRRTDPGARRRQSRWCLARAAAPISTRASAAAASPSLACSGSLLDPHPGPQ